MWKFKQKRIWFLAAYIAALHVVIFGLLAIDDVRTAIAQRAGLHKPEPHPYVSSLHDYFVVLDQEFTHGHIVLIGDSHVQRMDMNLLLRPALNFGAGTDTVRYIRQRVHEYQNLDRSSAIIIWAGVNDLLRGRSAQDVLADMRGLLSILPEDVPVILLSVPASLDSPINGSVEVLNEYLRQECAVSCIYVDLTDVLVGADGFISAKVNVGDGWHLNRYGYEQVALRLNAILPQSSAP